MSGGNVGITRRGRSGNSINGCGMRFFGLKSCDTCRKAQKQLREAAVGFEVIDVRADGLGADVIADIVAAFGDDAVNKRSATWRALTEAERNQPVSDLLSAHPLLLKRPTIVRNGNWTQGWGPEVRSLYLGG